MQSLARTRNTTCTASSTFPPTRFPPLPSFHRSPPFSFPILLLLRIHLDFRQKGFSPQHPPPPPSPPPPPGFPPKQMSRVSMWQSLSRNLVTSHNVIYYEKKYEANPNFQDQFAYTN